MKNIHVISTDKPSRLWMTKLGNLTRCHDIKPVKEALGNNVNIYITNDEEIKEGEYQLYNPLGNFDNSKVSKAERLLQNDGRRKKIILTTDQDLIKDGVQTIDDEFLEWFVQNPSCEEVEVVKTAPIRPFGSLYKTIIPKEESKQETLEEAAKDYIENTMRFSFNSMETKTQANRMLKCVEFGAKWQQERMYSEEEVKNMLIDMSNYINTKELKDNSESNFNEWVRKRDWFISFLFEKFKKK